VAGVEGGISPTCGETVVRISNRDGNLQQRCSGRGLVRRKPPAIRPVYGTPGRDLYFFVQIGEGFGAPQEDARVFCVSDPLETIADAARTGPHSLFVRKIQQPLQFTWTEAGL